MSSAPRTWPAKSRRTSRVAVGARPKRTLPWALPTRKSSVGPKAEAAFARALDIDACYAKAHNALGNVYALQGDLEKAVSAYRAALACDAELRDAYYGFGHGFGPGASPWRRPSPQFEEVVRLRLHSMRAPTTRWAKPTRNRARSRRRALRTEAFVRHWRGDEKVLAAAQSRIAHLQTPQ